MSEGYPTQAPISNGRLVALLTGVAITFGAIGCTTLVASGQISSTLPNGTAPITVVSTTVCPNLNAALLNGTTWTAPGAIGGTTPAAISCTTLTASGIVKGVDLRSDRGDATGAIYFGDGSTRNVYHDGTTFAFTHGASFAAGVSCTTLTAGVHLIENGNDANVLRIRGGNASISLLQLAGNTGTSLGLMGYLGVDNFVMLDATGVNTRVAINTSTGAATFSGGVSCTTLTASDAITGPKVKLTPEGGIATLMVADEAIAIGSMCSAIQGGTANRVKKTPTSGNENDMPIGVAYSTATAAGDSFWMVVSGRVGVLPDTGVTAAQGYVLYSSATTAGLVAQTASPSAGVHFKECGHFLNTGTGAGVITDAVIHFN